MMHSHKDALTETIMEPVVLILVVMDDALAPERKLCKKWCMSSLNPCCNG